MNFLAHIYLSGNDPEVTTGNFIGDSVKGSDLEKYPEGVQKGVLLHRFIDDFTDNHPVVLESKKRLWPEYSKYAPVITDIYYDHFLARQWGDYANSSLNKFAQKTYDTLGSYQHFFPLRSQQFYNYMVTRNILVNYAYLEGIQRVMEGMAYRAKFDSGMETAVQALEKDYEQYQREFTVFFPELEQAASGFLASLET